MWPRCRCPLQGSADLEQAANKKRRCDARPFALRWSWVLQTRGENKTKTQKQIAAEAGISYVRVHFVIIETELEVKETCRCD